MPRAKSPSVVLSGAAKSIHVFDNGALAASGKVETKSESPRRRPGH
jgi:hypothetical protein